MEWSGVKWNREQWMGQSMVEWNSEMGWDAREMSQLKWYGSG